MGRALGTQGGVSSIAVMLIDYISGMTRTLSPFSSISIFNFYFIIFDIFFFLDGQGVALWLMVCAAKVSIAHLKGLY